MTSTSANNFVNQITSNAMKKHKLKVNLVKNFDHVGHKYRFVFFSNKDDQFVLAAEEKDLEKFGIVLGCTYYLCKLEAHENVEGLPILKIRMDGKSLITKSKLDLGNDVKKFEDKQISNVSSKVVSLSENISASAEVPLKDKKLLSLYEFAKVDPKFLRDDQFVEVVILDSYATSTERGFVKIFVASRDLGTASTLQIWMDPKIGSIADLLGVGHIKRRSVLHIRANIIRNKSGPPIFGLKKGEMNGTVLRDRKIIEEMIRFKYLESDLIITDEAYRLSGNLQMSKTHFDDKNIVKIKEQVSYKEFANIIRIRANQEAISCPCPGNAAIHVFDLESEGEKNEFSGNVAVKNSLVPAEVFALPTLINGLDIKISPGTRYLIFICPIDQGLSTIGDKPVLKIDYMIPADEESLEDLELLEIAESGSKRPSDGDTSNSKVQKIG